MTGSGFSPAPGHAVEVCVGAPCQQEVNREEVRTERSEQKFHKKLFTDKAHFHSGTNEDRGLIRSAVCDGHIQVTTEGQGLNATRITQATDFWGSSCLPQPPYQQ